MKTITSALLSLSVGLTGLLGTLCQAQDTSLLLENPGIEELPPSIALEGFDAPTSETAAERAAEPEPEVIRERYPNRRVKIEREVIQDEDQNYINHGEWKMWDEQGNVLVEGTYDYNERAGLWTKIYRRREEKVLTMAPFNQGQLPLTSQANFKDGKLDGDWIIYDANNRKLCEWSFTSGRRDDRSTWWFANGRKMREIHYMGGSIDGELNEWNRSGKKVTQDRYDDGRRLRKKVEDYPDGNKKSEGTVLYPRLVLENPDDWWNCTLATYTQQGKPEKHGKWVSWYPNGQRKLEGRYEHDAPSGEFIWWHENGQKSLQAHYTDGKKNGSWTWWHANGQKSIQGHYVNDDPTSEWLWWHETGQVAQRANFSDADPQQVLATPSNANSSPPLPSARKGRREGRFLH